LQGLDLDGLLRRGFEVAGLEGALTQLLHREEDPVAVAPIGFPELFGPVRVFGHHGQHIGEGGHRLHWRIPLLFRQRRLEVLPGDPGMGLGPLRGF
jgi:hypothetical protein